MWIKENHRRINKSLPIITTKAITELGKIYNRLKSWILGMWNGKAVRREFCTLAPGSRAASVAASAVLSYTEQTEQHFGCLFLYLSASSYNLVQPSIPSFKNQNKQNLFMQNVEKIWGEINNSHRFLNALTVQLLASTGSPAGRKLLLSSFTGGETETQKGYRKQLV